MSSRTLVLGLGNLLLTDEGFGIHAIRRLQELYVLPADVDVVDGGTLGLGLLPLLEAADRILVLDAIDVRKPPGSMARIGWDEAPRALQLKISPHQETLSDALALLEFRSGRPAEFEIVGAQPESLEMGLELSESVECSLDAAVDEVAGILRRWGHPLRRRESEERKPLTKRAATLKVSDRSV